MKIKKRWLVLFCFTAIFSLMGLFATESAGDFNLPDD